MHPTIRISRDPTGDQTAHWYYTGPPNRPGPALTATRAGVTVHHYLHEIDVADLSAAILARQRLLNDPTTDLAYLLTPQPRT